MNHYFRFFGLHTIKNILLVFGLLLHETSLIASGKNYFQQEINYTIHVQLDDTLHRLNGFEEFIYRNNSPDTLRELYIHLWPNAYRNEWTALGRQLYHDGNPVMTETDVKNLGYIDSLYFMADDDVVRWQFLPDTTDICRLILNRALIPGASVRISTPFRVKIPDASISRMGHSGQAYFITQWYPKPAVYDPSGWNYFSYLDRGEYYGEFGTFDVYITLPANYVTGATGELPPGDPELKFLQEKSEQTKAISSFSKDLSFPASDRKMKTLHYHQDRIHDFAWFADKRFHVLKGMVILPASGREVTTWALFTNAEADLWKRAPEYISNGITYHSGWVGDYPYNSVTSVDVTDAMGGGMEYPMINAIGSYGSAVELELTIFHETGHNWFYGILGSNERKYPWMDEGITNFFETRYMYTRYRNDSIRQEEPYDRFGWASGILHMKTFNHRDEQYWRYLKGARQNSDQSPGLPADQYNNTNYSADVYRKTALGFDYLLHYLGDSLFDTAMKAYYETWKFRHPGPEDIRSIFEKTTGQDLDWFFTQYLATNGKIDYSMVSEKRINQTDSCHITVRNKNTVQAPLIISEKRGNRFIPVIKSLGFSGKKTFTVACDSAGLFRIDAAERMPELYRNNNSLKTSAIFRKTGKISLKLLPCLEKSGRTQVFITPVAGWNLYNGVMAGSSVYNVFSIEKKFEYSLTPFFAFSTKDLNGFADLRWHFYPRNKSVSRIELRTNFRRFAYAHDSYSNPSKDFRYEGILHYLRSDNSITFSFRPQNYPDPVRPSIKLRALFIRRSLPFYFIYAQSESDYLYFQAAYTRQNDNPLHALKQTLTVTFNADFIKAGVESKRFYSYGKSGKGFDLRMFAGMESIRPLNTRGVNYALRLSGYSGTDDYLFEGLFPGRSETSGIWSQQFLPEDGAFKTPTLFYRRSSQWMLAVNGSTSLPGILPFRIFFDLGTFNNFSKVIAVNYNFSFDAGIEVRLIKDIFAVYFPVFYSDDIKYVIDREHLNFGRLIRFELNLEKLGPLYRLRKVNI